MINWKDGGWTGSLNRLARKEVRCQIRGNSAARRSRYTASLKFLLGFFSVGTFGRYVKYYVSIYFGFVLSEVIISLYLPDWLPSISQAIWSREISDLLSGLSSHFITAQVGVLGVISLALALVTILAQRERSSTDVRLYYFESCAFGVIASSVALLAVLCAQLVWPAQLVLDRFNIGVELQVFELCVAGIHLAWLLVNLTGLAHFIATTLEFVQHSSRERMRERYTAHIVLPKDLFNRVREQLYASASSGLFQTTNDEGGEPNVFFGVDFGERLSVEIESNFSSPVTLSDLRVIWLHWALRSWARRCRKASTKVTSQQAELFESEPTIWFTPRPGAPLQGRVEWCCRRGGILLNRREKLLIQSAFRFRRKSEDG